MEVNRLGLFHRLVESDENLNRIREFLSERININLRDERRNTPLHTAAMSSRVNIGVVRELINAGADVNLGNDSRRKPLHFAVFGQKHDVVEALLQAGANINALGNGFRALHIAINGNAYSQSPKIFTAPFLKRPDIPMIEILLRHENINVNARNRNGETPLMWAVKFRLPRIVEMLLEREANPNICNYRGESPLHEELNALSTSCYIAYLLLLHGADLYKRNYVHQTPIHILIGKSKHDQYLMFTKHFVKLASKNLNEDAIRILEENPVLSSLQQACGAELNEMSTQVISQNLTIKEFLIRSFNAEQFTDEYNDLCAELYKPFVDILMTRRFSVYLHEMLMHINKFQLYKVLRYNLLLKNKLENSRNIPILNLLRMTINCDLSVYLSHWEIFNIILSISDLSDNMINSIKPFGLRIQNFSTKTLILNIS